MSRGQRAGQPKGGRAPQHTPKRSVYDAVSILLGPCCCVALLGIAAMVALEYWEHPTGPPRAQPATPHSQPSSPLRNSPSQPTGDGLPSASELRAVPPPELFAAWQACRDVRAYAARCPQLAGVCTDAAGATVRRLCPRTCRTCLGTTDGKHHAYEAELQAELEAEIEAELEAEIETEIEAEIEAEIETEIEAELSRAPGSADGVARAEARARARAGAGAGAGAGAAPTVSMLRLGAEQTPVLVIENFLPLVSRVE